MGEAWRGRRVSPSILTGRRAASSPVNYYDMGEKSLTLFRISCYHP